MNNENSIAANDEIKPTFSKFWFGFFCFAFGIVLPLISFTVEITTRINSELLFDPMPSIWYVLLVLFVPIVNLQTWWAVYKRDTNRLGWLGFANSIVIFIALFYTIIYLPLLPIALIALIYFLIGLLPLTPLLSLISAILLRKYLVRLAPENKSVFLNWKGLAIGFGIVFVTLFAMESPYLITRYGVEKASSADAKTSNEGIAFLRSYGNQDYILRNCYHNSGKIGTEFLMSVLYSGLFNDTNYQDIENFRAVYYRLTGKTYNSVPRPFGVKNSRNWDVPDEFSGESEDGEIVSGNLITGLSLSDSRVDGSLDNDAAIGYLEWTLTFKNETYRQQEAVAQLQLPPGAVVSRLTLWINGEENEAAFAGRERVKKAYEAVTAKKRDPVLVTTSGKDRIQIKCFPVEPGKEMKTRVGITIPLLLENENKGLLKLPRFIERNFDIKTNHFVWVESKKPLEAANPNFKIEEKPNLYGVRGEISHKDLAETGAPIRAVKANEIRRVFTSDKNAEGTTIVQETLSNQVNNKPSRLIFAVDTSEKMRDYQTEIAEALKTVPNDVETKLVLAGGNGLNAEISAPAVLSGSSAELAEKLKNSTFGGGADNIPALTTAWQTADEVPNSAIIWLHAPQPMIIRDLFDLKMFRARRPNAAPLYILQTKNGFDVVEKELDIIGSSNRIPRFGLLKNDLEKLFGEIFNQKPYLRAVRRAEKSSGITANAENKETSAHLARLWANDEVLRLLALNDEKADFDALTLATKYQIVTPVSGAVVLETQAQYDQFGLRQVDKNSVPTIPEPHEYLLFFAVTGFLLFFAVRRYFA